MPALAWFGLWIDRRRGRHTVAFTNLDVLAPLVPAPRPARWLPLGLLLLATASASVALARPTLRIVHHEAATLVLLLVDVSGSMNATDVTPSRLSAAEGAVDTFAAHVPGQVRVGLISFNESSIVVVPPTLDRTRIARGAAGLAAGGETAIGDALDTAVQLARTDGGRTGRRAGPPSTAIVLLSDGAQDAGALSPLGGALLARAARIPVYTVALGSVGRPTTANPFDTYQSGTFAPNPRMLAAIAEATGGRTYRASSAAILAATYRRLGVAITRSASRRQIAGWFSGLGGVLLLAALAASRRGWPALP